jgi:hypothetical protein
LLIMSSLKTGFKAQLTFTSTLIVSFKASASMP